MRIFHYRGLTSDGFLETSGKTTSLTKELAIAKLALEGVVVAEIKEMMITKKVISTKILKDFMYELSLFLDNGMNIDKIIERLSIQSESKQIREICIELSENIQLGEPLSASIEKLVTLSFPRHIIEAIRSGEKGNKLVEVVKNIESQLEIELMVKSKLSQALIYPAFIISTAIVVVVILMTAVIPRVVEMYRDTDIQLPLMTRIVIWFSDFFVENIFILSGLTILMYMVFHWMSRKSKNFRKIKDLVILKIPIYGELLMKREIIRFAQVTLLLLSSGQVISSAFAASIRSISNHEVKKIFEEMEREINLGKIKERSASGGLYKPILAFLSELRIGIVTNKIEVVLMRQENYHKSTLIKKIDSVAKLIEPISILFIGVIVGLIMLAVMQPMFSLSSGL